MLYAFSMVGKPGMVVNGAEGSGDVINQRYFGGELSQQVFYDQLSSNTLYNLNHLRPKCLLGVG